jgi:hypothetical protein
MNKDKNLIAESSAGPGDEMSETEIDKTLNDSFPASDPPSWTLGTDHREGTESVEDKPAGGKREE